MPGGEDQEPKRMREDLHAFTGVEHGPVAGGELVDDAERDERVVARPRADCCERRHGDGERDGIVFSHGDVGALDCSYD